MGDEGEILGEIDLTEDEELDLLSVEGLKELDSEFLEAPRTPIPENEKFFALYLKPDNKTIVRFIRAKSSGDAVSTARKGERGGFQLLTVFGPGVKGPDILVTGAGQKRRADSKEKREKKGKKFKIVAGGIAGAIIGGISGRVLKRDDESEFEDKRLINVPIFTPGHIKDSLGKERDFTHEDISSIIDAFSQGVPPSVPIKMGHSSDEFNSQVATALGIPDLLVQGEGPRGKGQVRLGEITAIKKDKNGYLLADMKVVEPIAKMISDGLMTGLSSELQFDREQGDKIHPIALSGLAFLGAQRAALNDLPSLQEATMLEDGTYADAVYFSDIDLSNNPDKSQFFSEGSMTIPNDEASSGSDKEQVYTVPVRDLTRGRQVFASVSAPNEITAKRTALRVVENFLFSVTGPLGTALGVAGGAILAARLIAGKPILGGVKGLIRWKFEEQFDLEEDKLELEEMLERMSRLIGEKESMNMKNRYAEHPGMEACISKAKADGIDNPEAHCKAKMDTEASESLSDIAKYLSLNEWDAEGIMVKVKELQLVGDAGSKFEEETTQKIANLEHKLLVSSYSEEVSTLTLVPKTTEEKALQLASLEQRVDKETATSMLEAWKGQQDAAEKAKIAETVLRPGAELAPSEFAEVAAKVKENNPDMSEAEIIKKAMRDNPNLASSRNGSA